MPHSEIPGSTIARISPGLFAACHVLHRLSVPRHPPDALHSRLSATPNDKLQMPETGYRREARPPIADLLVSSRQSGMPLHLKTLRTRRSTRPTRTATPRPVARTSRSGAGTAGPRTCPPLGHVTTRSSPCRNQPRHNPDRTTPQGNPNRRRSKPLSARNLISPTPSHPAPCSPRLAASLRDACRLGGCRAAAGGGGERTRTDDLLLAKQALSQLSYTPGGCAAATARQAHRRCAESGDRLPSSGSRRLRCKRLSPRRFPRESAGGGPGRI